MGIQRASEASEGSSEAESSFAYYTFNRRKVKDLIGNNKILQESYSKIPNRTIIFDLFQSILLRFKFYGMFRILFGGFIILVVTKNDLLDIDDTHKTR